MQTNLINSGDPRVLPSVMTDLTTNAESSNMQPLNFKRSLCVTELLMFRDCPRSLLNRRQRRRKLPRELAQIAGDLVHKAASIEDADEREVEIKKALARVPEDLRQEAETATRELLSNVEALEDEYLEDSDKEKLFRWDDNDCWDPEATGWQLVIKPDEIGMLAAPGRKGDVLQIADLKSGVRLREKLPYKAKKQLLFFAMVSSLLKIYGYEGPIRMVVKWLGSGEESEMWYSPHSTAKNLGEVRQTIREIEERAKTGQFETRTGLHCNRCPYRQNCEAFQAYQLEQPGLSAEHSAAQVRQVN